VVVVTINKFEIPVFGKIGNKRGDRVREICKVVRKTSLVL